MRVSHLALTDYRSYRSAVVEIPPGVVALQGQNGRGKTNLVEALAYLGTFTSHRGASSVNLVRIAGEGEEQPGGAVVRARVESGGRSHLVELEIARGRANRARLNRAKVPPRQVLGTLRAVVFAPEDLALLKGDPSARRTFLDEIAVKLKPHHHGTLQDFQKVLRQRAAVLKQLQKPGSGDESVLEVWDHQVARLSAIVATHRIAVARAIQPLVASAYTELTDADRLADLAYVSHLDMDFDEGAFRVEHGRFQGDPEQLVAALEAAFLERIGLRRQAEIARGINLVGAHRDDMTVTLDGLPVKGYASHGEIWTAALTLRLAEAQLLVQDGNQPVLILDDVFAELDEHRRSGLLNRIEEFEQVLVTVAVPSDVPSELNASILQVTRDETGGSVVTPLMPGEDLTTTAEASVTTTESGSSKPPGRATNALDGALSMERPQSDRGSEGPRGEQDE